MAMLSAGGRPTMKAYGEAKPTHKDRIRGCRVDANNWPGKTRPRNEGPRSSGFGLCSSSPVTRAASLSVLT